MKKLNLSFVFLIMFSFLTYAQDNVKYEPYNRWEIGINAGVANSVGSTSFSKDARFKHVNDFSNKLGFGYGFLIKKNFTHVFALEGAYNGTTITGSPKSGLPLTTSGNTYLPYKTGINEFALNTVWNMSNLFSSDKFDRKMYWYMKLGVAETNVKNIEYSETTSTTPWSLTIPIGIGLAFSLTDNIKLDIGTQWSWVNSNRLDGVNQGGYPAIPRVNPGYLIGQLRDQYLYTHAGLTFALGKKPEKPAPVVEAPKPQPQVEAKPEPKPEPKPVLQPAPPKHVTSASVGQLFKVYFAFDKWDLNANSKSELDRLVIVMKENSEVKLEMKSHTDSRGSASYNMKLSEKRGKSVLNYLTAKGISTSRVNAQAFGETQLTNKCSDGVICTEAEHQANRRTETLVIE